MIDHTPQPIQSELPSPKLCECGCGQPAPIAKMTDNQRGYVKGQPRRFIAGHNMLKKPLPENLNPAGLCQCGCGQRTPLATQTRRDKGHVKGQPLRFVAGHASRITGQRTIDQQFWRYAAKAAEDVCWLWEGRVTRFGYGYFGAGKKRWLAHRASYHLHNGPIPENLHVLHRCDVPACVNPAHLFLGTHGDNMRDMYAKGRQGQDRGSNGQANGLAKLTEAHVYSIRQRVANGESPQSVARVFGVSRRSVRDIVKRKTWKHI